MGRATDTPVLSPEPSPLLLAFVKRQISQAELAYAGQERRAGFRQLLAKPVLAYPADDRFSPRGPSHVMVIRDVSPRGLALVHEEQLNWPLVLLRISLPEIEALVGAVVRRSQPVGPFYLMGCEIHSQFDNLVSAEG